MTLISKKIYVFLVLPLLSVNSDLLAQKQDSGKQNVIIIGELNGRTNSFDIMDSNSRDRYFLNSAQIPYKYKIISRTAPVLSFYFIDPFNQLANNRPNSLIQYRFYDSEWELISDLILDKIDFARLVYEESAREIAKSNRSVHILPELLPKHLSTSICFNCKHPVLKLTAVRQALAYAIDKNAIVDRLLKKRADVARGPFNSDFDAYESSLNEYKYNPKKALRILKETGWQDFNNDAILENAESNPLRLELLYRKGLILDEQLTRWIKINWNQIGIDVQPHPLTYDEIQKRLKTGKFDAVLLDLQFSEDVADIERFFAKGSDDNFGGFYDPKIDNYVSLYQKISNPTQKKILLQSIQKIINDEEPVVFLYFKWLIFNFINRNRVENYLDNSGNFRPVNEWKNRAETVQRKN